MWDHRIFATLSLKICVLDPEPSPIGMSSSYIALKFGGSRESRYRGRQDSRMIYSAYPDPTLACLPAQLRLTDLACVFYLLSLDCPSTDCNPCYGMWKVRVIQRCGYSSHFGMIGASAATNTAGTLRLRAAKRSGTY